MGSQVAILCLVSNQGAYVQYLLGSLFPVDHSLIGGTRISNVHYSSCPISVKNDVFSHIQKHIESFHCHDNSEACQCSQNLQEEMPVNGKRLIEIFHIGILFFCKDPKLS